jgi:hypothetical protein
MVIRNGRIARPFLLFLIAILLADVSSAAAGRPSLEEPRHTACSHVDPAKRGLTLGSPGWPGLPDSLG